MSVERGTGIMRTVTLSVPVEEVIEGDRLFGQRVYVSEPQSDYIWRVLAEAEDEEAGIELLVTTGKRVTVTREVPLGPDQCKECGRSPVKYAAKNLCSRCYQRQHRATARKQSQNDNEVGHHRKMAAQQLGWSFE